ncbi:MAG: AEC family transporter [Clostridiales Family XIII bacterium]|jgi:predicted permease|nr:AEC family transporter [Clostridiales Family XIII bacterium]
MIIIRVLCIFSIVLVGLISSRLKWLDLNSSKYLSKIVINIASPCVIISSMTGHKLTHDNFISTWLIFGLLFAGYILMIGISTLLTKAFRVEENQQGVYKNFFLLTNNGFMGIPVAMVMFSKTGVFYLVIANIVMNIFVYSIGILNLRHKSNDASSNLEQAASFKRMLKDLCNIPMVSSLIGLLIFFLQIPVQENLTFLLDTLGAMMAPLTMMIIGIQLSESHIKRVLLNHKLTLMSLFRLIILPGIGFAVCLPLVHFGVIDKLQAAIFTINWAFPCAAIGVVFAEEYKRDVLIASEGTFLSTFFSIFTLPLFGMLLIAYSGG